MCVFPAAPPMKPSSPKKTVSHSQPGHVQRRGENSRGHGGRRGSRWLRDLLRSTDPLLAADSVSTRGMLVFGMYVLRSVICSVHRYLLGPTDRLLAGDSVSPGKILCLVPVRTVIAFVRCFPMYSPTYGSASRCRFGQQGYVLCSENVSIAVIPNSDAFVEPSHLLLPADSVSAKKDRGRHGLRYLMYYIRYSRSAYHGRFGKHAGHDSCVR